MLQVPNTGAISFKYDKLTYGRTGCLTKVYHLPLGVSIKGHSGYFIRTILTRRSLSL